MKRILYLVLFSLSIGLLAQEGQNLISNGDFRDYADGEISCWMTSRDAQIEYHVDGGPSDLPFVSMLPCENAATENKFRVINMTLVPGEKYRLSAWVRTKYFSARLGELVLINSDWTRSEGLKSFPANTGGWKRFETEVACPESASETQYGLVMVVVNQKGILDLADV